MWGEKRRIMRMGSSNMDVVNALTKPRIQRAGSIIQSDSESLKTRS